MEPKKRINPLSRRPKSKRLVVAVRGAAGAGKSVFASTMAEAGIGKLCYFDVERKARLLVGSDGSRFDAIEIEHPDELPEFIEWAINGEGKEQNYGCFVLDSWAMYFGRKHRETVQAVRERSGDPTALPSAEELAADQMVFQEILRRLCMDSGKCVVITDQIGAKGKEDREENELGRVLPMTSGGLEYFVDVMVEISLRLEGFKQVRVMRVVKTNSTAFPIGMELINPTFNDFLVRLNEAPTPDGAAVAPPLAPPEVPAHIEPVAPPTPSPMAALTLEDLLSKAQQYNLKVADVVTAAKYYYNQPDLQRLNPEQVVNLYKRLVSRMEGTDPEANAPAAPPANPTASSEASVTNGAAGHDNSSKNPKNRPRA